MRGLEGNGHFPLQAPPPLVVAEAGSGGPPARQDQIRKVST